MGEVGEVWEERLHWNPFGLGGGPLHQKSDETACPPIHVQGYVWWILEVLRYPEDLTEGMYFIHTSHLFQYFLSSWIGTNWCQRDPWMANRSTGPSQLS